MGYGGDPTLTDRVVEHIPYSLVDVKPHGRTGIDRGYATDGFC